MPWRRLLKSHTLQSNTSFENVYHNIISKLFHGLEPPWNQIEIDPCFRRIDCNNFNVQRHSKICQIEVTSTCIDNGSILISIWHWSMPHFPPRYMKNCQMPTSIFVGCFSPRIHKRPQDGKTRWFTSYSGYYFTNITMEMCLISKRSMSLHIDYFGMPLHKN